jgi:hypothetical protein
MTGGFRGAARQRPAARRVVHVGRRRRHHDCRGRRRCGTTRSSQERCQTRTSNLDKVLDQVTGACRQATEELERCLSVTSCQDDEGVIEKDGYPGTARQRGCRCRSTTMSARQAALQSSK